MAKLQFSADTSVPPERVLEAITDFSDRRPEIWPSISRKYYEVHEVGDKWAEVTEGSDMMGGIWARERYEWSEPNTARATIMDSNIFKSGIWELRVEPRDGGSHVEINYHRQSKGLKGRLLGAMATLMGRRVLPADLRKTLEILEREPK
jgi:polyketide cyclase/dehydrase/lipid transport protein